MSSPVPICARCLRSSRRHQNLITISSRLLSTSTVATVPAAATASAITPAPSIHQLTTSPPPIARFPRTQPPSHRPPEARKSQLHRQYTSILRSSPLILLFQHNNLKSPEWTAIRRELSIALRKVDASMPTANESDGLADGIKLQIIQSGVFGAALRVVEHFGAEGATQRASAERNQPTTSSDPRIQSSATDIPNVSSASPDDHTFTHSLSRTAWLAAQRARSEKERTRLVLEPLLAGPLALATFPAVSTAHLKVLLSYLAPAAPQFPAPRRKETPGYYDPAVQSGLQKLLLLGARVEGSVFDVDGTRWVGGIQGGMEGLRAQLLHLLQSAGAGVTGVLEGAGKSLYFTVEGRRMDMEEKEGGKTSETAETEDKKEPLRF
ncbi:hypothetical protein MMC25_001757 [Agyrium rufum]|nr:hypothetical protein [Agyrium rufum]